MDLPFTLQDMRQGWECPLCAGGEFQVQDELQILIRCAHGNVEQATRETDPESQGQGSLVSCCLWGRTESDTTEVT